MDSETEKLQYMNVNFWRLKEQDLLWLPRGEISRKKQNENPTAALAFGDFHLVHRTHI